LYFINAVCLHYGADPDPILSFLLVRRAAQHLTEWKADVKSPECEEDGLGRIIGGSVSCGLRIGAKYLNEGSFSL